MSDFTTFRDVITEQPNQQREHYLVTRARHAYENALQAYNNSLSNWAQDLCEAWELETDTELLGVAENNLQAARQFVAQMEVTK